MGLMDKFKNLFTDEEMIDEEEENEEIEIKEIKKEEEHKLPTFMREKIEREKQEMEEKKLKDGLLMNNKEESDRKIQIEEERNIDSPTQVNPINLSNKKEENNEFKFPIDLNDNDFIETRSRQTIHKERISSVPSKPKVEKSSLKEPLNKKDLKVAELYKDKKETPQKEEKKFKATPIISPIYGVLDQNYTSGEVEENKGENLEHHRHSKNVDFDSVRKKAYGNLTDEIRENLMCENCEYLKEAKECKKKKEEKSTLIYDLKNEEDNEQCKDYTPKKEIINLDEEKKIYSTPDYSNITLDEATENYYDYGVEYEKTSYHPSKKEENLTSLEEHHPSKKEIPPVKSSINLLSTLKKSMNEEPEPKKEQKDLELTDDLFNLIDSMYEERKDNND